MNMDHIPASLREFVAEHGGELIKIGPGLFACPDGACVSNRGFGGTGVAPPPNDEAKRRACVRKFLATKLAMAEAQERKLDALCRGFGQQVDHIPELGPRRSTAAEALADVRKVAARTRESLAELDALPAPEHRPAWAVGY